MRPLLLLTLSLLVMPVQAQGPSTTPQHNVAATAREADKTQGARTDPPGAASAQAPPKETAVDHCCGDQPSQSDLVLARLVSIATIVGVVAAIVGLIILYCTLKATEAAANAAKDAAMATIHANRPYLLNTRVRVSSVMDGNDRIYTADLILENFGTGTADILDYIAIGEVFDAPRQNPDPSKARSDPAVIYGANGNRIGDPMIGPGKEAPSRIVARVKVSISELAKMPDTKRIAFHGRIRYQGTPQQQYETRFFWWWLPSPDGGGANGNDQCVRCLTPEYNSHT